MAIKQRFVIEKKEDGSISGGKAIKSAIDGLSAGRHTIELTKYIRHRTGAQNRLAHLYFQIVEDETGTPKEKVKDAMKKLYLEEAVLDANDMPMCNPITGEALTYVKDTSALNTVEMYEFTEKVRIFFMDFDIHLPLPEEQLKMNY